MQPHPTIRIGTSGYSFKDWIGPFYPAGTRPEQQLEYYAQHFDCLELNVTHYRIPDAELLAGIERRTPPGFELIVKLHRDVTHGRTLDPAVDKAFADAVRPLEDAGKMKGYLAQFPYSFHNEQGNRAFVARLRDRFPSSPLFVEFRHASWLAAPVRPFLRNLGLSWVSVDEPQLTNLLPPEAVATSDIGYVRFHGRNASSWYGSSSGGSDRYDYSYNDAELREWADKIRRLVDETRRVYVFFNNCHAGQAPANAQAMKDLLQQLGF